jgi:hypothetical protein
METGGLDGEGGRTRAFLPFFLSVYALTPGVDIEYGCYLLSDCAPDSFFSLSLKPNNPGHAAQPK